MALVKSVKRIGERIITINQCNMNTNLCLIVKLLSIAVLVSPVFFTVGKPFLSYFEFIEFGLKGFPVHFIWKTIFYTAGVLILLNVWVRSSAVVMGLLIFIGLALSENVYSNNIFFCGCLFFLCGMSSPKYGTWPIVVQLMIMYFGAAIDKLFSESWRDGTFYTSFHGQSLYFRLLKTWLPSINFALIISWGTIFLEFALIPLLYFKKTRPLALYAGLAFHLSTALLGQTLYSIFIPALLISYIALLPNYDETKLFKPALFTRWHYLPGFIRNIVNDGSGLRLEIGEKKYFGTAARFRLFIMSPLFLCILSFLINLFVLPQMVRLVILFTAGSMVAAGLIVSSKKYRSTLAKK